jgi:hypothetical protein
MRMHNTIKGNTLVWCSKLITGHLRLPKFSCNP